MRLLIISILMFNTWALKERALFSINGEVQFTADANFTLRAYQYSLCLIKNKNLIKKVTGLTKDISFIKPSSIPFDSEQKRNVIKAYELNKVIAIENEYLVAPSFKRCHVPKKYRSKVTEIFNANKELLKRHKNFVDQQKQDSLEDYKALIFKPIQSRLFL